MFRLHNKNKHAKSGDRVDFKLSRFKALQVHCYSFHIFPKIWLLNAWPYCYANVYMRFCSNAMIFMSYLNNVYPASSDHLNKFFCCNESQKDVMGI